MKCFIAAAFGHDDVDAIYDRCIIPTLKKLSVTPLRVDRVEHNEDIDKKIFDLLDSADFVIADLTYARPSAYYEAGYAAGKPKPVIYIARGDHFKARDDDPHGNLRVHFDLQMRNIIAWTMPNQAFSNKLLKRVQHVLRPLERQNHKNLKLQAERAEFDSSAVLVRLILLQGIGAKLLRRQSFSIHQAARSVAFNALTPTQETQLKRFDKTRLQAVSIIVTSSASKRLFNHLCYHRPSLHVSDHSMPKFSLEETHYIVVSLKPIPRSRITESMPYFHLQNNATFVSGKRTSYDGKTISITYVHTIDGIKSETEFLATFHAVMDKNGLVKGA